MGEYKSVSVTLFLMLPLFGLYVTRSSDLFLDLVRSWFDNLDALFCVSLELTLCENLFRPVQVETPFRSGLDHSVVKLV